MAIKPLCVIFVNNHVTDGTCLGLHTTSHASPTRDTSHSLLSFKCLQAADQLQIPKLNYLQIHYGLPL